MGQAHCDKAPVLGSPQARQSCGARLVWTKRPPSMRQNTAGQGAHYWVAPRCGSACLPQQAFSVHREPWCRLAISRSFAARFGPRLLRVSSISEIDKDGTSCFQYSPFNSLC
jgi:hypothetical protein